MNTLAFDTCLGAVSVAVCGQDARGKPVAREAYEEMAIGQAERLMPMIAEVMGEAGLAFADLDRIAVTRGPGSFTGVRVGVAAARALALATRAPIVAVTSLAVMSARAASLLDRPALGDALVVAVDARRGALYAQMFDASGAEGMTPPEVLSPEEAAQRIGGRRVTAVGSGATLLADAVAAERAGTVEPKLVDLQPHASVLAQMAHALAPVTLLEPLYLRPPDAKPQPGMAQSWVK